MCKKATKSLKNTNVEDEKIKKKPYIIYSITIISMSIICLLIRPLCIYNGYSDFVLLDLCDEIGKALFILGSVSILLEIDEISGFFVEKLRAVVLMDECVARISPPEQERVLGIICEDLYYTDKTYIVKDFFKYCHEYNKNIIKIPDACFYDKYDIMVECTIHKNGEVVKEISRIIELTNAESNNSRSIIFPVISTYMKPVPSRKTKELFQIKRLFIDNEEKDVDQIEPKADSSPGDDGYIHIQCENQYKLTEKAFARLDVTTIAPIDDNVFSHELDWPCKRYSVTFTLNKANDNTKKYEVVGVGLSPRDGNMQTYHFANGEKIIFNNWVPTGTGVQFTFFQKHD